MKNIINKLTLAGLITAGSFGIFGNANGQSLEGQISAPDSAHNKIKKEQKEIKKEINRLLEEWFKSSEESTDLVKISSLELLPENFYSEALFINLNEKRSYFTKKNEEDGIKDIIKINKDYEEAWLYLPEKQVWYEIGIFSNSYSVKPYFPRIEEALKENKDIKELVFYHNHLGEGFDRPSMGDLVALVNQNRIFPKYKIISKVITKDDITEYCLNSKTKEEALKKINFWGYRWSLEKYDELSKYFDIKCANINLLNK